MLYRVIIIAIIMSFGELGRTAHAVEAAPRITDREIIQGLVEIKGEIQGIKARLDSVDKRFDVMQHNMDNRFDSIEKKMISLYC